MPFTDGLQSTGVKATATANRNVTLPLISLQKYYYYDSSTAFPLQSNLHNASFLDLQTQLKPAIKCRLIVEAIETQYNIEFGTNFFGTAFFENLYLWLHREKTPVTAPPTPLNLTTISYGINL